MARIKEVCEKTGLSEKAIRLYMKEGLIQPQTEAGIYRNAYYFSEDDIETLHIIFVLRNAGFSIREIQQIQQQPELLQTIIEEKQQLLAAEIYEKKAVQIALERLTETERGTVKNLASGLEGTIRHKSIKKEQLNKLDKNVKYRVIGMVLVMAWFGVIYLFQDYRVIMVSMFLLFILGMLSVFMGIRYFQVSISSLNKFKMGEGYIAGVIQNGGIDISFARAGGGGIGAKESGAGSEGLLFMMLWNEIRPDNYYPIIQYKREENGELLAATLRYGAVRNTWKEGEKIKIAWNEKESEIVLPSERTWLKRKSVIYVLVGIFLWGAAICMIVLL